MQKSYKFSLVISMALLLILIVVPQSVYARWPPFKYTLTPRYENGKIIYNLQFLKRVKWPLTQVTFKIPLPEGTRYVESNAQPTTSVSFDGVEVTFFSSVLHEDIEVASFVVEVTDPTKNIFTARTWISWEGEEPGSLWAEDVSIDIRKPLLDWADPSASSLQLEAVATVTDDIIIYSIYPKNVRDNARVRMQDVEINVSIPEGTTYLSAEASSPFAANFNGQEVSFTALELERWAEVGPLNVKVSAKEATAPFIATHAWASWKNTGRRVGTSVVPQEETTTGSIIVQPHVSQWVVSDLVGDVPFSNYDLTSLALQDDGTAVGINFYLAGSSGPVDVPLSFYFLVNSDCRTDTGALTEARLGAEYRVKFKTDYHQADIDSWDGSARSWVRIGKGTVTAENSPGGKVLTIALPYNLIGNNRQFCWVAQSFNRTTTYNTTLPSDQISSDNLPPGFSQFKAGNAVPIVAASAPETVQDKPDRGSFISTGDVWQYLPGWSEPPANWSAIGFDDSSWFSGPTSLGYGKGKHATDLSQTTFQQGGAPVMVQRAITEAGVILAVPVSGATSASVFMRHSFTVDTPVALTQLRLEISYLGGFVAYLNGTEVARRGLGVPGVSVLYNMLAADQADKVSETIDLGDYIAKLTPGVNILAVQAHRSEATTNLSITPKLTWVSKPKVNLFEDDNPPSETSSVPVIPPSITDIQGKLAVPLDNSRVAYDIHIFSLPGGQETLKIPNARQPNFRFDGQRLLINREGGGVENVFEYNLVDGTEKQVSDAPGDSSPFYDPGGNRVVYGNPELTYGKPEQFYSPERNKYYFTGVSKPFIFVQCGLLPPHQEQEPRCRDIPTLGVLIPAGQMSELQGTYPVWTSNDMIAYKGCNSWSGFAACGIYLVPSSSTKGFSDGFIPRQLTKDTSDTPTDTKGNLIAFMSQRDGNWEAYVMDLNGAGVKNLSNSLNANDGLPTISPDTNWVAFVSDRDGSWAIWVAPIAGGPVQKLFDLPATVPWGDGNRAWTNERISWGP